MKIIDKNTDFYDYLQNVYYDPSTTFDRTDAFVLTKDIMCDHLAIRCLNKDDQDKFCLLQVCNSFWLFLVSITKWTDYRFPANYIVTPIHKWKNYDKNRKLLSLDVIEFRYGIYKVFGWGIDMNLKNILGKAQELSNLIDIGDYQIISSINKHKIYHGDGKIIEKHIPLLKASGFSDYIDPIEIYTALEEYFSLVKQANERTESIGLTDKEKIENHGFDMKTSFRGKGEK